MFKPGDKIISTARNPEMNEGRHWRAKLGFIYKKFLPKTKKGPWTHLKKLV